MNTNIKAMRKARKMTQDDLAAAVGVTKRVVSSWERNESEITLEDACAIADVFSCTLDELAGRNFKPDGYTDRRQESMNRDYASLSEEDKNALSAMVSAFATSRRASQFQSDNGQGVA